MDGQRINTFNTIQQIPFISKRFALKRFLGMTDEELAENQKLWAEENGKAKAVATDASGEMRSAGISQAGIESDINALADENAPPEVGNAPGQPAAPSVAPNLPIGAPATPTI
jgi:hypothetical protein